MPIGGATAQNRRSHREEGVKAPASSAPSPDAFSAESTRTLSLLPSEGEGSMGQWHGGKEHGSP